MARQRLRTLPIVPLLWVSSSGAVAAQTSGHLDWINQSIIRPRAVSSNLARNFDERWSVAIVRYKTIPAIIALS